MRTIGLCHGVQGAHHQITRCIERWAQQTGQLREDESLSTNDVDVIAAGLNHQTWFIKVGWRGQDIVPRLLDLFVDHPDYRNSEKVRIDVLRRFGYYSTESNGHLSEYLPWYRKRTDEIARWIDTSNWIHGETGGYLRVCTEGRNWFEHDYSRWLAEEPPTYSPDTRSHEHGSYIIEALATGRTYRGHFNVVNRGHITNLPDGCIVEIPGYVDRTGLHSPVVGPLPMACAATCAASARVQEMGKEAALRGDVTLLKQAMLHDPLVGAVCNPEEVWQLVDDMLVAQAQWLPQYAEAIPAARQRLADHEANGTRVARRQTTGAARLHTRSVNEMAKDREAARTNADAADKGKLTTAS